MSDNDSEYIVVGAGVVGLSIALGLLQNGCKVIILNGDDSDLSASKGNFGLVWLQGKGSDFAPYAKWTHQAVTKWPAFAKSLEELSQINLSLEQTGGYEFFTDENELSAFQEDLKHQHIHLGNLSSYEVLSGSEIRKRFSGIGESVVGATYCPLDGQVNPLHLLKALRTAVLTLGGKIISNTKVKTILPTKQGGFELSLFDGNQFNSERVILAAGLGANPLAKQLGFTTQVRPERGEMLITEKISERLPFISSTIRQVNEGGIQIGGTKENVDLDDSESLRIMTKLAHHAVSVYPQLADVRINRAWGALRILSPDNYPVYAESKDYPGAYLITCHSGVTLSSIHSSTLVDWIIDSPNKPNLEAFSEDRFSLSSAA